MKTAGNTVPVTDPSAVAWGGFVVVVGWTMAFLGNALVSRTVDGAVRTTSGRAIVVDLALLLLFAVQHSVMARSPVKMWMRRRIPVTLERAVYVLATNACLVLLLVLWQPWGGQVWQVGGAAALAIWALFLAGWAVAVAATFAVDHLSLLGLRQAGWGRHGHGVGDTTLRVAGLHALVRHPLMSGLLLGFWATPRMGASHLLFALAATVYVVVGIAFEERDLRRAFGVAYDQYASRVPAVIPGLHFSKIFRDLDR